MAPEDSPEFCIARNTVYSAYLYCKSVSHNATILRGTAYGFVYVLRVCREKTNASEEAGEESATIFSAVLPPLCEHGRFLPSIGLLVLDTT
jgi:hypothetical protein